jgi:SAM-dependent methyltransferase
MQTAEELQRAYYSSTAGAYAAAHESDNPECEEALQLLLGLLPTWGAESLLDVGSGTGRVLRYFQDHAPGVRLAGLEPVAELIASAEAAGLAPGTIQQGSGLELPFAAASWDVVTAFGVLHHVAEPARVIAEMLRVARKAVVISDSNRFAQGRPLARYTKLALSAAGLWPLYNRLRTRGKGYQVSKGDGVYWSYSVFDSMSQLRAHSRRLLTLEVEPAKQPAGPWSLPLLNAPSLLVAAIK